MLKRRLTRSGTDPSNGQAMVEFGIVSVAFFLMLIGIFEGGRLLFTNHQVNHAAREGARFAAAQGYFSGDVSSEVPVQDHVQSVSTGLDWSRFTLTADWPGDENCGVSEEQPELNRPGCPVAVNVAYEFVPFSAMIFGFGSVTLEADSAMRVHY